MDSSGPNSILQPGSLKVFRGIVGETGCCNGQMFFAHEGYEQISIR